MRRLLMVFAGLLLALAVTAPASAITRTFINCPDGVPCEASLSAHIDTVGPAHLPWVISIPTPAGVCLTVGDVASDGNILITVVEPNGLVYRAAGSSTDNLLSLPHTIAGWQTIEVDSEPPAGEQIVGQLLLRLLPPNQCYD